MIALFSRETLVNLLWDWGLIQGARERSGFAARDVTYVAPARDWISEILCPAWDEYIRALRKQQETYRKGAFDCEDHGRGFAHYASVAFANTEEIPEGHGCGIGEVIYTPNWSEIPHGIALAVVKENGVFLPCPIEPQPPSHLITIDDKEAQSCAFLVF